MSEDSDYWFQDELKTMLWVAGDCKRPLPETCRIVEVSIADQLASLIHKAHDIAQIRNKEERVPQVEIEPVHLFFVLRKNTQLIGAILGHMKNRDVSYLGKWASSSAEADNVEGVDDPAVSLHKSTTSKRARLLLHALSEFDVNGQYEHLYQMSNIESGNKTRLAQILKRVSQMSGEEYTEFTEARKTAFSSKSLLRKFRDWLCAPGGPHNNLRFSQYSMEILAFVAGEIMHTIVDCALTIKAQCGKSAWVCNPSQTQQTTSQVNMQLATTIRQRQLARGLQPSATMLGAIDASAIQPGQVHEAVRRLGSAVHHPFVTDPWSTEAEHITFWLNNPTP